MAFKRTSFLVFSPFAIVAMVRKTKAMTLEKSIIWNIFFYSWRCFGFQVPVGIVSVHSISLFLETSHRWESIQSFKLGGMKRQHCQKPPSLGCSSPVVVPYASRPRSVWTEASRERQRFIVAASGCEKSSRPRKDIIHENLLELLEDNTLAPPQ